MHLFLKILGVTGIVLGSLLGILLLIILLILFVPVFYRISGTNHDGQHHIHGKVSWLFPVLAGKGNFENGVFALRLRLFGFCVMRYPEEETLAAGKRSGRKTHQKSDAAGKTHQKIDAGGRVHRESGFAERTFPKSDSLETTFPDPDWDMDTDTGMEPFRIENEDRRSEYQKEPPGEKRKVSKEKKKASKKSSDRSGWQEPMEESGENGKSSDILHTLGGFLSFFQDEGNKAAFRKVKKTLLRLLRTLRPRKIKGSVIFGAGDPALTGQILGIIAIIYGMIGYGIEVHPDFNETRLDYQFEIAGHISVFSLIMPMLSLWRSGQLQVLKQNFENIINDQS